jgi:hypothetical protein
LTHNERPVNNFTGENTPNGCAASTNLVNGSVPAAAPIVDAAAFSEAAYNAPPEFNACTNCSWNVDTCALTAWYCAA